MSEKWRPIPGWDEFYEVSGLGRVRTIERRAWCPRGAGFWRTVPAKVLKPLPARGYYRVALCRDGRREWRLVHHLVLLAFVGPRPDGLEACHYDDDPANNNLGNLRWDTRSANHLDRTRNGGNPNALKTHCPQGHTLADAYINPNGSRKCRPCAIARAVAYKQKRKAA